MFKSALVKNLVKLPATAVEQYPANTSELLHDQSEEQSQRIGAILVECGSISIDQAAIVLDAQRRQHDLFGAIAVKLGFCEIGAINRALASQTKPLHLQANDRSRLAAHIQNILADSRLCSQFSRGVTHLELRWFTGGPERRCLSFVAANPNEGCSTTVAMMAILFAQSDRKVLIIDAACNNARQARLFGLQNVSVCLEDALENPTRCMQAPSPTQSLDLKILTSRNPSSMPAHSQGKQFAKLLDAASNLYDIVLIDTPPISERTDAYTIAMRSSGAVAIVRLQKSLDEQTKQLVHGLNEAGVELVGTIGTNF